MEDINEETNKDNLNHNNSNVDSTDDIVEYFKPNVRIHYNKNGKTFEELLIELIRTHK